MVSVTDYKKTPTNYVNVELIKSKSTITDRRAIIIGAGEYRTFTAKKNREGVEMPSQVKLVIPVEMGGLKYDFSVSRDSASVLSSDLESDSSDNWVGAVIQFEIAGGTSVPYVKVVVIQKPLRGAVN